MADHSVLRIARIALILFVVSTSLACSGRYLKTKNHYPDEVGFAIDDEAEIADTTQNRQVIDVLLQYRQALVKKDVGTLKRLISARYYENGGTTDTTRDDYGHEQLPDVFELMAQHTDQIRYDVTLKRVQVKRNTAFLDYEFRYAYEYKVGESPTWDAGLDVNRLELESEDGEWKIVSGL